MCGRNLGNLLIPALAGILVSEKLAVPSGERPPAVAGMLCPQCKSPLSPEFAWCPKCGQALHVAAKPQLCAYCGQTLPINAQYCPHCGGPSGKK